MTDLAVGAVIFEVAPDVANSQPKSSYVDESEVEGEEKRADREPHHDKRDLLSTDRHGIKDKAR